MFTIALAALLLAPTAHAAKRAPIPSMIVEASLLPSAPPPGFDGTTACTLPKRNQLSTEDVATCQPCALSWTGTAEGARLAPIPAGCADPEQVGAVVATWPVILMTPSPDPAPTATATLLWGKAENGKASWALYAGHPTPKVTPAAGDAPATVRRRVSADDLPSPRKTPGDKVCRVAISLDADGQPTGLSSVGCPRAFAEPVLEAAAKYRFRPATQGGVPVASSFTLTYKLLAAAPDDVAWRDGPALPTENSLHRERPLR